MRQERTEKQEEQPFKAGNSGANGNHISGTKTRTVEGIMEKVQGPGTTKMIGVTIGIARMTATETNGNKAGNTSSGIE
jgi:hypothetical protein